MIDRFLKSEIKTSKKSILLLGPRQVGKSTLIESLKPDLTVNLADESEYLRFSGSPGELKALVELHKPKTIFIDEIQRIPSLLNTIQYLIDSNKSLKFYLTGSSARKLRRGGANLLPGRVLNFNLGPLVSGELHYQMDTQKALSVGTLPEIYTSDRKLAERIISTYAVNYIKDEIKTEAVTKNLEGFIRFFNEVTLHVSEFIDYSKLARKVKVSRHSLPRFFDILEDTLIGHRLYPFAPLAESCDLIKHPQFFFFDNGVYNSLLHNFIASHDRIGVLSEQLVYTQLLHSAGAQGESIKISTFRTRKGLEIDFIVEFKGKTFAIEVKNTASISSDDSKSLVEFKKLYKKTTQLFIFHMEQKESSIGPVKILPWQLGLKEVFG